MPVVLLVIVAWLYVALMMSLAEATHADGTVIGALFTFVLYGVGPVAIVTYIMTTPARKRAIRKREAAGQSAPDAPSGAPDGGGKPAADAVAPVREEP